jgi:hypothetical protein
MMDKDKIEEVCSQDDYVQSANTLFNFMKEPGYLYKTLRSKAIFPRYCKEDIRYLNIHIGGKKVEYIYVLQKCFCDIPLHKLMDNFDFKTEDEVSETELNELNKYNTHPDYYGKYGIGFSKFWCEKNEFQPIQYMNERADFTKMFSQTVNTALDLDDVNDIFSEDVLRRLAFIKPIRGTMERRFLKGKSIKVQKNFHDEKEWRYVPGQHQLSQLRVQSVVGTSKFEKLYIAVSNQFEETAYSDLWLTYDYNDIRYLIVPDSQARIDLINVIKGLEIENFENAEMEEREKDVLISKILVLDEIRKDW